MFAKAKKFLFIRVIGRACLLIAIYVYPFNFIAFYCSLCCRFFKDLQHGFKRNATQKRN